MHFYNGSSVYYGRTVIFLGEYMIFLAIILIIIFMCLPLGLKIIITILNMIIPDNIPVMDELITICGTLGHIIRAMKVVAFSEEHPILFKALIFLTVAAVIGVIVFLVRSF